MARGDKFDRACYLVGFAVLALASGAVLFLAGTCFLVGIVQLVGLFING